MARILIVLGVFFLTGTPSLLAAPIVADSFSTTWDTGATTEIGINLGACPSSVYWEEIGSSTNNGTTFSCDGSDWTTVDFPTPGEYRVDFSGSLYGIGLYNSNTSDGSSRGKFRTVEQWGIVVGRILVDRLVMYRI